MLLSSVILSIIKLVSKNGRIEINDDSIIVYKYKEPIVYTWTDVQEIHVTKFNWGGSAAPITEILCSLVLRPFCVNVCLRVENGENPEKIEFSVSKRFAKSMQQHFSKTKETLSVVDM